MTLSSFAQNWPRYVVGGTSGFGLYNAIRIIVFGVGLHNLQALSQSFEAFGLSPEEDEKIAKAMIIIYGLFSLTDNGFGAYAAIKKSLMATRVSLGFWLVEYSLISISILMAFVMAALSEEYRQNMGLNMTMFLLMNLQLAIGAFFGWSLLVLMRDIRGQARNGWGVLIEGDYEPLTEENPAKADAADDGPIRL